MRRLRGSACLRPLTPTVKRCWIIIPGLFGVLYLYLNFWGTNYQHVIESPQPLAFNTTKSSTNGIPEANHGDHPDHQSSQSTVIYAYSNYDPRQVSEREPQDATTTETITSKDFSLTWKPREELSKGYGRVPFPIENSSALPTATEVLSYCRRSLDYLFFIHTAPDHSRHRRILRESVGSRSLGAQYNWTMVFFVGLSTVQGASQEVIAEAQAHGDIVVLPYLDTYRNLTYKFVYGMKWTTDNCPGVRFLVKMDDDVVIHIPAMIEKFGTTPETTATPVVPKINCNVLEHRPVDRDPASRWYVSNETYPKDVFPRYCAGCAVFMEASFLPALYNASFSVPFISVDDAYVTGELAAAAGIGHEGLNDLYCLDCVNCTSMANGSLLVVELCDTDLSSKEWKIVVNALSEHTSPGSSTSPMTQTVSSVSRTLSRVTQTTAPVTTFDASVTTSSIQIEQTRMENTPRASP